MSDNYMLEEISDIKEWLDRVITLDCGVIEEDEAWDFMAFIVPTFLPDFSEVEWETLKTDMFEDAGTIGETRMARLITCTVADIKSAAIANAIYNRKGTSK